MLKWSYIVSQFSTLIPHSTHTVSSYQPIQSWTVVMIVVPWVLLMVGVATAVILCACKKGKSVHESKPFIFHGKFDPRYNQ